MEPLTIPAPARPDAGADGARLTTVAQETAAPAAYVRAGADGPAEATARWLETKSPRTRASYLADLKSWIGFLDALGVDPAVARKREADEWRIALRREGLADTSTARRMAAVSSWYRYLIASDLTDRNPIAAAERPKVDRDYSATSWLDEAQARALIAAADTQARAWRARNAAIVRLMLTVGVRVTEVVAMPVTALGYAGSQRTVLVAGKGGKRVVRALPASTAAAIDAYLAERAARDGVAVKDLTGPLFVSPAGQPLDRNNLSRSVQAWARAAGIAQSITPHSLRHSFATITTQRGADLDDLQDAMGHADPRTTRRYQRAARRLERDPSHLAADALG